MIAAVALLLPQQLRQLRDVGRDPSRFVAGERVIQCSQFRFTSVPIKPAANKYNRATENSIPYIQLRKMGIASPPRPRQKKSSTKNAANRARLIVKFMGYTLCELKVRIGSLAAELDQAWRSKGGKRRSVTAVCHTDMPTTCYRGTVVGTTLCTLPITSSLAV